MFLFLCYFTGSSWHPGSLEKDLLYPGHITASKDLGRPLTAYSPAGGTKLDLDTCPAPRWNLHCFSLLDICSTWLCCCCYLFLYPLWGAWDLPQPAIKPMPPTLEAWSLNHWLFSHYVWLFVTSRTAARQASLSSTISQSLLKLMSIELVMPSNQLIVCHPLLLLPSVSPSFRGFSSEPLDCQEIPVYLPCFHNATNIILRYPWSGRKGHTFWKSVHICQKNQTPFPSL